MKNTVSGRLLRRTYLGTGSRLQVAIDDLTLTVSGAPHLAADVSVGDTIHLHLPAERLWTLQR